MTAEEPRPDVGSLDDYFNRYQRRLLEDFERTRAAIRDSDVKGGVNERIVADFVRKHVAASFIVCSAQIMDSYGMRSDELDVCACNVHQPIMGEEERLLIAEGVDFVVQVKARLTTDEIRRFCKNAASVKRLRRQGTTGDTMFTKLGDVPYFVDRVPYLGFAFDSALTLETATNALSAELANVPLELQPDGMFVVGRGTILNFREGAGRAWSAGGTPLRRLVSVGPEQVLINLIRFLHVHVPLIQRVVRPMGHYFSSKAQWTEYFNAPGHHRGAPP